MYRIAATIALALAVVVAAAGCDLFDPSEEVVGAVVVAATGAPVEGALVQVGYRKPNLCEIISGKPCGSTPFEVEGSGRTGADGSFSVSYDPGPANTLRVQPCPEAEPGDCPYFGASVDLPASGQVRVELALRE